MANHDERGRFAPGNRANPNGRPRKKRALSELLRTVGNRAIDGKRKKLLLAETLWDMALKGDIAAIRLIYEYCDGKPLQRADIAASGEVIVTMKGNVGPDDA